MILTLLLTAALAAGLVPLIQRDLHRAVERRRWRRFEREFNVRFEASTRQMVVALQSIGLAGAVAAARLREGLKGWGQDAPQ